jgi:phenylacetate-CoA ligase
MSSLPRSVDSLLARARALEESERWRPPHIAELQAQLAQGLLAHACRHVPFYRERSAQFAKNATPGTAAWRGLPLLSRATLLREAAALQIPPAGKGDGPGAGQRGRPGHLYKVSTSGSTGEPVVVWRTEACREVWEATALREHRWQGRDATRSMAIIRAGLGGAPPAGQRIRRGLPFDRLWRCGPTWALDLATDVAQQAAWLRRIRPHYLLTYPANLEAVLGHLGEHELQIAQVVAVGGAVSQAARARCREVLRCGIAANYSSQEAGMMALECAHCGQLHVQAEHVVLEVLDDHGEPCAPGEAGRIVVTDLHNYQMPLIRYDIGDYAVVGEPCSGGIGLPSLRAVLGRRRNMLVHADGRRHWPLTGFWKFRDVAPVLRYQLVQHDLRDLELRVAVDSSLGREQVEGLRAIVAESLAGDFVVRVSVFPGALPEAPSAKFEEFVSHVA